MIFSREVLFLFAKNRLVSSAKRVNLKTFDDVMMSFIYIRKRIGPRTDP